MRAKRFLLAVILAVALGAAIVPLLGDKAMLEQFASFADQFSGDPRTFPPLSGSTGWVNADPLTPDGLRGKVVLVEFWTYSCINWLRTQPYTRAWAEKYGDQGLVVIGVHSPEFGFEKNLDNVRRAAKNLRVDFPIAIDSDHAVWRAFNNRYWPAYYLIDAHGRIRDHQFGEGNYDVLERAIQDLLTEAGASGVASSLVALDTQGFEAAADLADLRSPETYVGYGRADNFASPGGLVPEKHNVYDLPSRLHLNEWALSGDWSVGREATALNQAAGRIAFRFHARDLHLVMGPGTRGKAVQFRVLIDGAPPGDSHGLDVDEQGNGTIVEPRLYQLVRQSKPIADRTFEIEFLDAGAEAFVFTFG